MPLEAPKPGAKPRKKETDDPVLSQFGNLPPPESYTSKKPVAGFVLGLVSLILNIPILVLTVIFWFVGNGVVVLSVLCTFSMLIGLGTLAAGIVGVALSAVSLIKMNAGRLPHSRYPLLGLIFSIASLALMLFILILTVWFAATHPMYS
jgi:hypothetical protein